MKDSELAARIDALYRVSLDAFVATRKALANELKSAGQKDAAARALALPKPNAVAAAVNGFYAEEPARFEKLVAAGARVREAFGATLSAGASAGAARALAGAQRAQRDAVSEAVAAIRAAAERSGTALSASMLSKLDPTLLAISTTGRFGDAAPGRLLRELEPPGLEVFADLPAPGPSRERSERRPSSPPPPAESPTGKRRVDGARERARLQAELDTVKRELDDLATERASLVEQAEKLAASEVDTAASMKDAKREVTEHRAQARDLERELTRVQRSAADAEARVDELERASKAARSKHEQVRSRSDEVRARLADLESKHESLARAIARAGE